MLREGFGNISEDGEMLVSAVRHIAEFEIDNLSQDDETLVRALLSNAMEGGLATLVRVATYLHEQG